MNLNESYYRRTISALGYALLIWFVLYDLFDVCISFVLPLVMVGISDQYELLKTLLYWGIYVAGNVICVMLPVLFLKLFIRKSKCTYQPMYAELSLSKWLPFIACACIAISFSAANLNSAVMGLIGYSSSGYSGIIESPEIYDLVFEFIAICIIPGFCEEFLFRGAILSNLLPFGKGKAIFISALLFSIMHCNASQIFYTFVAGLFLGVVYEKTHSIWNCIIIHIANNFIAYIENVVFIRITDQALVLTCMSLIELVVSVAGVLSVAVLAWRFFSQKETKFQNGFFGKRLEADDEYALYPVGEARAKKLFFAPSMIVFLSLCVLQIIGLVIIVLVGGEWIEFLG